MRPFNQIPNVREQQEGRVQTAFGPKIPKPLRRVPNGLAAAIRNRREHVPE
jgi:hypothetical protein